MTMAEECDRGPWGYDPDESPLTRPVPRHSGEGAIYTPEYLRKREGNAHGTDAYAWRLMWTYGS
ncbi:hypothetical protein [Streptomyces sp. NPDC055036]